jgi:hypothetical protein
MAGDPAQALAAQKLLDSEDEKGYANLVPVGLRNHIETQATQYIVQPKVQSALSVAFGGQAQTQQPAQDEQPSLHDASLTSTTTSSGAVLSQTQINAKSMKANLLDAEARGLATLQNDPELAANPTRLKVAEAQLKDTFQTLRYEQQSRQLQEAKAKDDMIIHFGNLIDKDPNANLLAQPGWSSLSPSQKENLLGYQQSAFQRKLFGGPNNPGPGYAEVTNLVRSGEITNPAQLMAQPGLKDKLTDWGVRSALEILKEWTAPGQEADKQRKTDLFSDIDNLVADGQNAKLDSSIGFRQSYMHSLVEAALLRGQTDGIPLSKLTNQQDKDSVWQTTIYPTMADPNFLSGAIFGPQGKNANAPAMPKPGTPAIQIPAPSFADPDGFKSLMKYSEGKVSSNGLAQAIQKMGPNPDPKTISQFNEAFAPFGYTWDIVKGYIQKKDIKDKNFQQMDLN